ncbi:hypothetical protein [Actinomadura madurae]|uniref:hypothetical protein n=1 Tax=Actinomadura madurae TaxID=1993 RepID=UPI0020D24DCE|nr:hypothetical protein [Actinomadura madurae]MCP9980986.1 hypothetical protein [Actinomadura madurae]
MDAVAVLVRGDVVALRYALLAEHLRPGIRLVVMLFDRTVADQLLRAVPNCQVTSPADIAVPAIVGACLGPPVLAVDVRSSPATVFVETADGVASDVWRPDRLPRRIMRGFTRQLRPHDLTSRILLTGLAGLAVTLLLEWALAVLVLHQPGRRGVLHRDPCGRDGRLRGASGARLVPRPVGHRDAADHRFQCPVHRGDREPVPVRPQRRHRRPADASHP